MASRYFTNITTCAAMADALDSASHARPGTPLALPLAIPLAQEHIHGPPAMLVVAPAAQAGAPGTVVHRPNIHPLGREAPAQRAVAIALTEHVIEGEQIIHRHSDRVSMRGPVETRGWC